jgi:hypothetical protein
MDNKKLGNNPFLFLNNHRKDYFNKLNNHINGNSKNYQGYILEETFFLDQNVDLIQKQVIMEVYKMSNKKYLIKFQKKETINIIMQYVFNEYAQHLPFNIKNQIIELNNKTVKILCSDIIENLNSHEKYMRDSTTQPKLLDRPENVSYAGNRTLPSVTTTF